MPPKRVLVVDDDPAVCAVLQALLSHSGYVCEALRSAAEASLRLHESDYDAVLVDHKLLGELNGSRARISGRAIVLTGATRAFYGAGVRAVLSKPVDLQAVLAHVAACTAD